MSNFGEYTRVNIAIRASTSIENHLIKLSKEIGLQESTYFTLDGVNFYPHATRYSPEYPTKNLGKIFEIVERIARDFPKFSAKFSGIRFHRRFIGVELELSDEVKKLHELTVQRLNPPRDDYIREKYQRKEELERFSEEQRKNIQLYGHPDAMNLFRPHFTITRLVDERKAEELAQRLSWPIEEVVIDKLAAFKMGQHGTCKELIQEFLLK